MSKINVTVVLPNREELEVSFPPEATPTDIIETLLESGVGLSRFDASGQESQFELMPKGKQEPLLENETLGEARVQNGDRLLLTKEVTAG
jgi:hypothetical protein